MCGRVQITLVASLLLMVQSQRARAVIDTIPPSTVPPPPGKLVLDFTTIPPAAFDRERLEFRGSARADGLTSHAQITYRLFWELPSGELEYLFPIIRGLDPALISGMNVTTAVDGCPTLVGVEFTTSSPVPVTVSGTFDHQCTIPEPGSFVLFALSAGCFALTAMRSRPKV